MGFYNNKLISIISLPRDIWRMIALCYRMMNLNFVKELRKLRSLIKQRFELKIKQLDHNFQSKKVKNELLQNPSR